jgi:hypothetical protein
MSIAVGNQVILSRSDLHRRIGGPLASDSEEAALDSGDRAGSQKVITSRQLNWGDVRFA